jgi:hypothetical protein
MFLLSSSLPSAWPSQHQSSHSSEMAISRFPAFSPGSHPVLIIPSTLLCGLDLLHLPDMQIFQPKDKIYHDRLLLISKMVMWHFQTQSL